MSSNTKSRHGKQEARASLDKVFRVMELVSLHPEGISLKAVSEQTGINHSTLSRVAANLVNFGYLRKINYRTLGPDIGLAHLASGGGAVEIPEPMAALLIDASEKTGLEASIARLHRTHVIFAIPGDSLEIGSAPFVDTIAGPVLLAASGAKAATVKGLIKTLLPILDTDSSSKDLENLMKESMAKATADGGLFVQDNDIVEAAASFLWDGKVAAVVLQGEKPASKSRGILAECFALRDGLSAAASLS